jgi:Beta-lactamase
MATRSRCGCYSLNHTSGLADYDEDPAVVPAEIGKDSRSWTSEELLAMGVKHGQLFPPGTKWSYSNTDYAANGAVLEKAADEPSMSTRGAHIVPERSITQLETTRNRRGCRRRAMS